MIGVALSCLASAQYSEWRQVGNAKGLTWRWRGQESVKTCEIEVRESDKLRTTTANLSLGYLYSDRQRKIGHIVTFMSSDVAIFRLDSCQSVDSIVADRVRRK
jgi:hypothetical protein